MSHQSSVYRFYSSFNLQIEVTIISGGPPFQSKLLGAARVMLVFWGRAGGGGGRDRRPSSGGITTRSVQEFPPKNEYDYRTTM